MALISDLRSQAAKARGLVSVIEAPTLHKMLTANANALVAAADALDRERVFICRRCGIRQDLGIHTEPDF